MAADVIPHPLAQTLVRRFCECAAATSEHRVYGPRLACGRCGLVRPRSGWSVAALTELKALMREVGSLHTVARGLGRPAQDCNQALDVMLGRTVVQALAVLESRMEVRS